MIELTVALPPAEALRRLEQFGQEWRESKMPPELRRRGFAGARTTLCGERFMLTLRPPQRGTNFVLNGVVCVDAAGSLVRARPEQARWSRRLALGWLATAAVLFSAIVLWEPGRHIGDLAPVVAVLIVMSLMLLTEVGIGRARAEAQFRMLLQHVLLDSNSGHLT